MTHAEIYRIFKELFDGFDDVIWFPNGKDSIRIGNWKPSTNFYLIKERSILMSRRKDIKNCAIEDLDDLLDMINHNTEVVYKKFRRNDRKIAICTLNISMLFVAVSILEWQVYILSKKVTNNNKGE